MTIDTKDVPVRAITIKGQVLNVPAPFKEGHVLLPNEAAVLNQVYGENIRNNTAPQVLKFVEMAGEDEVDLVGLQTLVTEYCNDYDFGVRRSGGSRSSNPVLTKALELARNLVRDSLVKRGIKLKDVAASQITEQAHKAIEKHPSIMEKAKEIVAVQTANSLDGLLDD